MLNKVLNYIIPYYTSWKKSTEKINVQYKVKNVVMLIAEENIFFMRLL